MTEYVSKPNAEIGDTVLWYPNADKSYRPAVGIVVGSDGHGCLELAVIEPLSTQFRSRTGVRHIADPYHKISPDVSIDCGGWEFQEEFLTRQSRAHAAQNHQYANEQRTAGRTDPSEEDILTILQLHEEGLGNAEIAERMGDGWNHQKVYHVIKKHGQTVKA